MEVFLMQNLIDFSLKQKYAKVKELRSRLEDMKNLINWKRFLPLFPDKETNRGRPAYAKSIPDYSTIWRFREELSEEDILDKIWNELQNQIEEKNLEVRKGVIQDASFITADPGKQKKSSAPRGRNAETSRSKDGTWTKKGNKSFFGFKEHLKIQRGSKIKTKTKIKK